MKDQKDIAPVPQGNPISQKTNIDIRPTSNSSISVICLVDFSKSSVNASKWGMDFMMNYSTRKIELVHCIPNVDRSDLFISGTDIFQEKAREDLNQLKNELSRKHPKADIRTTLLLGNIESLMPDYTKDKQVDFIIMGTKGLTTLKEMTIGSKSQSVMLKSKVPVIVIPNRYQYKPLKKIMVGIDKYLIEKPTFLPLQKLSKVFPLTFLLTHVLTDDKDTFPEAILFDLYFDKYDHEYIELPDEDESIAEILTDHAIARASNMLCLVNHKRKWWEKLFGKSVIKDELYEIEIPILILPEQKY